MGTNINIKRNIAVLLLLSTITFSKASEVSDFENYTLPVKLQEPEMPACLQGKKYKIYCAMQNSAKSEISDIDISENKYSFLNEGMTAVPATDISAKYGYHSPIRELTLMPVPLVLAGFIAKSQKKNFREARQYLQPEFHHRFDDQLQFGGIALALGLKLAGVEGRSNWGRFAASSGMSYGIMALIVNVVKNSAHEMRPDGSTANSFPSGHTATAFVGATILHKEYGLTRSPWFSVAGYAMATTTGVMRSLNNRHWISDILVGAGIGVLSTDLGYMVGDALFKKKGLVRKDLEGLNDLRVNPSFFSISMGASFSNDIPFSMTQLDDDGNKTDKDAVEGGFLRVGTATQVQAELGYFPFKSFPYIGFGGRLRIATAPVRANGMSVYETDGSVLNNPVADVTDQMAIFSEDLGLYFQYPLSKRLALGGKILAGSQQHSEIRLAASIIDYTHMNELKSEHQDWTEDQLKDEATYWGDQIQIYNENNFKWGAGVSLTYAYRNSIAWKLYADYDSSKTGFTGRYYSDKSAIVEDDKKIERIQNFSFKKTLNQISIGASMSIMF